MISELFLQIEALVPTLEGWCVPEKACEFASIITSLRPEISVEIGVWGGRGTLSMALAHRFAGRGKVIAIDPWSATASVAGQTGADAAWWGEQQKHDYVYERFMGSIQMLSLMNWIEVQKKRSDAVEVPKGIGFIVIDGNHSDQAVEDVKRYAPNVRMGGVVYMDDLSWSGGGVQRAANRLLKLGFEELYRRDQGAFFQRVKIVK